MAEVRGERRGLRSTRHHGEHRRGALEPASAQRGVSPQRERRCRANGEDAVLGNGRLAVTIECSGSGFLKIGPAIAALEEEAEGLGTAFYWTLTYALYRVMRIYNHDDALQYEERMKEYAEDDDKNREQYEFPEVEKALPECIQKTLTSDDHRAFTLKARRLLRRARGGEGIAPGSSGCIRLSGSRAFGCQRTFTFARMAAMTPFLCRPCWWPSRNTTRLLPVSTKRASTCWKEVRSRR